MRRIHPSATRLGGNIKWAETVAAVVADPETRALLPGVDLEAAAEKAVSDPKTLAYLEKVESGLARFESEDRKVVLDEMIAAAAAGQHPADRLELLAELHGLRTEKAEVDAAIDAALAKGAEHMAHLNAVLTEVGLMPLVLAIERRAKLLVLPAPTTAANAETLLMSYAYWLSSAVDASTPIEIELALKGALHRNPDFINRVKLKLAAISEHPHARDLLVFGQQWFRAAFARLEVGHKLAASLCLTDVPDDVEVRAPWEAWSLVVPDGLFPDIASYEPARAWCVGTAPRFIVMRDGFIWDLTKPGVRHPDSRWGQALDALVRGACLALSNPDEFRKEHQHRPSARSASKKGRHGPPDLQQARFLLSAPVKVDLREHVTAALSGKSHASPTVQFLVRGHWRNQAHGPKHSLRKTIWVQPFWKGPEESRVLLLRQHRVEDPKEPAP